MTGQDEKELEALYGPAAPFSEHKRGNRVKYLRADGKPSVGIIVWIQAAYQDIPVKYIIAPDDNSFLDFALPSDVLIQEEQEPTLVHCVWCGQLHPIDQVQFCPLKPR